jgi:hypothetical protein
MGRRGRKSTEEVSRRKKIKERTKNNDYTTELAWQKRK